MADGTAVCHLTGSGTSTEPELLKNSGWKLRALSEKKDDQIYFFNDGTVAKALLDISPPPGGATASRPRVFVVACRTHWKSTAELTPREKKKLNGTTAAAPTLPPPHFGARLLARASMKPIVALVRPYLDYVSEMYEVAVEPTVELPPRMYLEVSSTEHQPKASCWHGFVVVRD